MGIVNACVRPGAYDILKSIRETFAWLSPDWSFQAPYVGSKMTIASDRREALLDELAPLVVRFVDSRRETMPDVYWRGNVTKKRIIKVLGLFPVKRYREEEVELAGWTIPGIGQKVWILEDGYLCTIGTFTQHAIFSGKPQYSFEEKLRISFDDPEHVPTAALEAIARLLGRA